ncbi:TlpA family protein disulfide reductase [Thiolinea disciformis]|uniref:TlpA family protein disulfide reductase n=1 Tax=Thiolinea disciformis TaxID=125614 RepID=UPI00037896DC|nr:TlpA disulfide reductase family protein [Thiolinea disciformis]
MRLFKAIAAVVIFLFSSIAVAQVKNFSFQDIYGKNHQFSDYRGKWVVVNYWSTQCQPCLAEIPALKNIAQRYRNKVVVLGMDAGETPDAQMRRFIREKGINYTVVPTQDSTIFALGLVFGVPTTYVISPQGKIVNSKMGAITEQELQQYFDQDAQNARNDKTSDKPTSCGTAVC